MSKRNLVASVCLIFAAMAWSSVGVAPARAAGWESIDRSELIQRSRYIGVGRLTTHGRAVDGWLPARIYFSTQIYSGIGEIETYELRVAIKDTPGERKRWRHGEEGVWFILKSGDKYEAINHPSCRADKSEAQEISDQVNNEAEKEYADAQEDAEEANDDDNGDGGTDSSDSGESVDAYQRMAEAATTAANTPYQNQTQQTQKAWDRMNEMFETAGIDSPFPKDVTSAAGQQKLFDQAKQMLGPLGNSLGNLPGAGDPARTQMIQTLQKNIANITTQLMGATLGAADPAKALSNLKPIGLEMPGGKTATPGGPPIGPGSSGPAKKPQFKMPDSVAKQISKGGSRKGMFNNALGGMLKGGGGKPSLPGAGGPKPPSGPRPGPGGGGPGGPGRGPGGPGPRGPGPGR